MPKEPREWLENPSIQGEGATTQERVKISIVQAAVTLYLHTPTHPHPVTHTQFPKHNSTVPGSLASNYHDNWDVYHTAQRLVNIFSGYSINSFITKQQNEKTLPLPPIPCHTHTHNYHGTHIHTVLFKCNGAVSNFEGGLTDSILMTKSLSEELS